MRVDLDGMQANILAVIPLLYKQERNSVEQLIASIKETETQLLDRTLMLHRFIAMAQERTWPAVETINEARSVLGWSPIESCRSF
jgi:hypothetical protein